MKRRTFLAAATAGLLPAAAKPSPNIVLILADDLGWSDIGCYGNRDIATPNLDRLAAQGARFTQAYAACPVCSPTRGSIMTGRYPVRTGVTDWIPGRQSDPKGPIVTPHTADQLKLEDRTIAECLKPAGYRNASVGKWHLGGDGFLPTDQGFDLNIGGNHRGSPPPSGKLGSSYFGPFDLPNLKAGPGEFITEKLSEAASSFIAQNRANPYFLYLAHYTVHIPLQAHQEDIARHRARANGRYNPIYAAMRESMDQSVGRVMEAVEKSGAADNTLLMFFSDNGGLRYEGKSPSAVTDNAPLRAGKGHLYEGGIREPLIVRYPGVAKPGTVIDAPVCSVDFLPTFAEMAGQQPGDVDGVSLLPLLRGGRLKPRPLFWHYPHYSNQGGAPGSAIREGNWKLIEFHADSRRELFNLADDPGEHRNLIRRQPKIAGQLYAKLDAWRKASGAIMPTRNPNADPAWPGFQLTGEEKPTPPE
ncbi:sulfatase [uncultured Paludibaculum sp.]|uniref:sulfatase n=1 Tax=uncultured Paludibaculum sp. TaxID=1765020 RepID=UPI002AAAAA9D|nr:sulfatase [uncultured Paludibaculum sp.]